MAPTSAVPNKARINSVIRSPRHAATGGVMLSGKSARLDEENKTVYSPGSTLNHLDSTMRELINVPKTALLNPAEPIPVAKTMTS